MYFLTLFILYAFSIEGFLDLFSALGDEISPLYLSFLLSAIGIGLGFLFYVLSTLPKSTKKIIILGIPTANLLIVLIIYAVLGVIAVYDFFIIIGKILFCLIMSSTSLFGTYGLIKRQKNTIITTGFGILFFFFFTKIVLDTSFSVLTSLELVLLFFILFITNIEMGLNSLYFRDALTKMMPNPHPDDAMLFRFNQVFNRYLIHVSVILLICYTGSLLILKYSSPFVDVTGGELMSIPFGTVYGMWILIAITVLCAFLLWFLIPKEKTKQEP